MHQMKLSSWKEDRGEVHKQCRISIDVRQNLICVTQLSGLLKMLVEIEFANLN